MRSCMRWIFALAYQEIGFEAADTELVLERSDIEKEDVTKGALQ